MKLYGTLTGLCAAAILGAGVMVANAGGHTRILGDMPEAFPGNSFVTAFPGNSFNERQLNQLGRLGVETMSDLVQADPAQVGRVLEIDPRRARALQQDLRQRITER
jgi:hypothetical protein